MRDGSAKVVYVAIVFGGARDHTHMRRHTRIMHTHARIDRAKRKAPSPQARRQVYVLGGGG